MAFLRQNLPQQKPLSGLLNLAPLMLDDFPQIGDGFLIVAFTDVVVGIGVVPVFHGTEVHGVTAHVADHVFRIVFPS